MPPVEVWLLIKLHAKQLQLQQAICTTLFGQTTVRAFPLLLVIHETLPMTGLYTSSRVQVSRRCNTQRHSAFSATLLNCNQPYILQRRSLCVFSPLICECVITQGMLMAALHLVGAFCSQRST